MRRSGRPWANTLPLNGSPRSGAAAPRTYRCRRGQPGQVSDEIAAIGKAYADSGREETQPRLDYPPYRSSLLRHPTKDLHHADPEGVELWAPAFGHQDVDALEADLTVQHGGEPIGERMVVTGRVLDGDGRPVRHQLVEIWQANAGGRYIHQRDQHPAPIDPNFTGTGRCLTDGDGVYRFTTIKPGPYPWKNHRNAWRPAHIHFSLFGTEFTQRMVTQMYFPGDPLFALDPIYQSHRRPGGPGPAGRDVRPRRHQARVVHRLPLGHRAHRRAPHPARGGPGSGSVMTLVPTPGQTVGPFFGYALPYDGDSALVPAGPPGRGPAARPGPRRRRRPGPGRAHRALAGRPRRPVPSGAGSLRRDGFDLHRLGARRDRRHRALLVLDADPRRAVLRADRLRARAAQPAVHPRLPAGPRGATRSWPASTPTAGTPSSRPATSDGFRFDIRLQGEGETVFLTYPRALTVVGDNFWPGDHRADEHFTDATFREAMLAVEMVWLDVLVDAGIAPPDARADLTGLIEDYHEEWLVEETESGGNPAMALVGLLRSALEDDQPTAAAWLHRGLTSQDVVDTALMLMAQDAVAQLQVEIRGQAERLAVLAGAHKGTPMVARTLTQHAVPTTFGLKAAQWLAGVLDAYDELDRSCLPRPDRRRRRHARGRRRAGRPPAGDRRCRWPSGSTSRRPRPGTRGVRPVTRLGDALVRCTDAWGRIAEDVLTLSRPEIGELSEGAGGGSSTMPQKHNPVLSVLVRRAAMTTPMLGATLHLAAAQQVDERADGAWHAEWAALRDLVRRTLVAASQAFDLVADLEVDRGRMAATLHGARESVGAEQWSMADLAGKAPSFAYLGIATELVDSVIERAKVTLGETPVEMTP